MPINCNTCLICGRGLVGSDGGPSVVWYVPENQYDYRGPFWLDEDLLYRLNWHEVGQYTTPGYLGYWPMAAHTSCMESQGISSREALSFYT